MKHAIGVYAARVLLVCSMLWVSVVVADESAPVDLAAMRFLDAAQIRSLLTDNTAAGSWVGNAYQQVFRADGTTIYAPEGGESTLGKWRIKESHNAYESWWPSSGWTSYSIGRIGERLYWLSKALPPQEFSLLIGDQLLP